MGCDQHIFYRFTCLFFYSFFKRTSTILVNPTFTSVYYGSTKSIHLVDVPLVYKGNNVHDFPFAFLLPKPFLTKGQLLKQKQQMFWGKIFSLFRPKHPWKWCTLKREQIYFQENELFLLPLLTGEVKLTLTELPTCKCVRTPKYEIIRTVLPYVIVIDSMKRKPSYP